LRGKQPLQHRRYHITIFDNIITLCDSQWIVAGSNVGLRKKEKSGILDLNAGMKAILNGRSAPVPLVREADMALYECFIRYGFGTRCRSLKCIFRSVFTYPQWKHLSAEMGFSLNATPTDLSFEQWLGLFDCFQH